MLEFTYTISLSYSPKTRIFLKEVKIMCKDVIPSANLMKSMNSMMKPYVGIVIPHKTIKRNHTQ